MGMLSWFGIGGWEVGAFWGRLAGRGGCVWRLTLRRNAASANPENLRYPIEASFHGLRGSRPQSEHENLASFVFTSPTTHVTDTPTVSFTPYSIL